MARLFLWVIPLALVALAIWLPSLIPAPVLAVVGWAVLSVAGIAGVALAIMASYARAMQS